MSKRNNRIKVKSTRNTLSRTKKSTTNSDSLRTKKIIPNNPSLNKKKTTIYSIEQARSKYRINPKNNINTKINKTRKTAIYANIFSIIIFISILAYFTVFFVKFFNKQSINYSYIEVGSIDSPKSATGIIIREEQVYTSPQDGVLSFNVSSNEKIKVLTSVATIKSLDAISQMEEELEVINKEIISLQESRAELSWFSSDVEQINTKIQSIIDENIYQLTQNDISKLYEISNSISSSIDMRNQIILSETTGSLAELASKRKEQEEKISQNSSNIINLESGIVSYYLDGLEEVLTLDTMYNLAKEQTNMDASSSSIKFQVTEGEPIFKIISSNNWYIATYVESSFVEGWAEGDTKTIYIKEDSKELQAQVYYIEKENKETFMILKLTTNILDYLDTRSITFELDKVKTGFKINNESIAEVNLLKIPIDFILDESYILKQTESSNINLNVNIYYEPDILDYAYIPIKVGVINIGDTIVNPNNLTETYVISEILTTKGVYIINTGITKYVKINLQNSISNEQYTILDTSLNTNLTIYDNIILDVKNIEDSQSIYN